MATIVLIPGAWITPSFYQPFLDAARAVGFPVHHANYPSLNPSDPFTADCQKDSDVLESTIRPLVEDQGLDVLLFMHSYAGMPGASAAVGLSKTERAKKGKAGGIIGLVFIAAFVVPENVSCAGLMGGSLPPWIVLDDPSAGLNLPADPQANFAADVPVSVENVSTSIKPHSTLAFNSAQPHPAWADDAFAGRLGYIVTLQDAAVPKDAQHGMVAGTQKNWIVKELNATHCSPFITHINETVSLVQQYAAEFKKKC